MNSDNPLIYKPTPIPEHCDFRISPSSFGYFITEPWKWYRQQVLKEDLFSHNTSSVTGTIVHYIAEQAANCKAIDKEAIEEYINSWEITDTYDPDEVRRQYPLVASALVKHYTLQRSIYATEVGVVHDLGNGIAVAGSIDILEGQKESLMLSDYKIYSGKTPPKGISGNYRYQLLTYAYVSKKNGYQIDRIRLVYVNFDIQGKISNKTGKRLKSYPPKVHTLTEDVTQENLDFIESQLELCKEALLLTEEYPEIKHLIWHDPRLKEKC